MNNRKMFKNAPKNTITYIVKPGDTLLRIASRNKTTIEVLLELNPELNTNLLMPGVSMCIPTEAACHCGISKTCSPKECIPKKPMCPPKDCMPKKPMCPPRDCMPERPMCPPRDCMPERPMCPPRDCMPERPMCPPRDCMPERPMCPPRDCMPERPMCPPRDCMPERPMCPPRDCMPERPTCPPRNCMPERPMCPPNDCGPMRPLYPDDCIPKKPICPPGSIYPDMGKPKSDISPIDETIDYEYSLPEYSLPEYSLPEFSRPQNLSETTPESMVPKNKMCPNGMKYTIKSGDTFYNLAKKYDITLYEILNANKNINPYNLQIGQEICIPMPETKCSFGNIYTITADDTLVNILTQFGVSLTDLMYANDNFNPYSITPGMKLCIPKFMAYDKCPSEKTYIIEQGDNLSVISKKSNVPERDLLTFNPNMRPNDFTQQGLKICLPAKVSPY